MAQVKAHEVGRYVSKPDPKHRTILIYGPDIGLVSETAGKMAAASGADLDDPFSTIKLDADDAASDSSRIADEAFTVSMFGGPRLIWIRGSTQKNLSKALEPVLANPPADSLIIIEAKDLKKSSPLRSRIEKCPGAVALPCYQDQARSINAIIDEELSLSGLSIEPEARQMLVNLLGSDRLASRGEVQKLCLYANGQATVSVSDIEAIVGDASSLAVDTVIDAACTGDIAAMEHTFKRLVARGTAVFQVVSAAQRHFQALHLARCSMDRSGSAQEAVARMRPPVNFQRKTAVTRSVSIWRKEALERMLQRLDRVSLESRSNAALSVELTSTTLLAIAIEARHLAR